MTSRRRAISSRQERAKEIRAASADARACSESLKGAFPDRQLASTVDFSASFLTPHVVERREPRGLGRLGKTSAREPGTAIAPPLVRNLSLIIPDSEKHQ
jgi:hypothetical protein